MRAVVRAAQGCSGWRHTARRSIRSPPEVWLDHSLWAGQARGGMWAGCSAWHAPWCWALLPPDSQLHITAAWAPLLYFIFIKNPLLPRGLYDEVNLSCAYLEPVSRRKKCQLLVFKNRPREHAFFCVVFFSFPLLADCLVVLTDERKIKTPSVIRHSRLVFVWVAI